MTSKTLNKQALVNAINSAHDARIAKAIADQRMNKNMRRELTSARNYLVSDSCVSFMLRKRFTQSKLDALYNEAQKTLYKVARTMSAIVNSNVNELDRYTTSLLRCAAELAQSKRFYDYQELQTMMSTKVTSNLSTELTLTNRRAVEATTTSTQASTSVHMMSLLNLATVETRAARKKFVRFDCERKEIQFAFAHHDKLDDE